ncbi:hypothetical protein DPEC_G00223210 [Dallia pectoralis]|uniref:Uncharacterized protein n=1 Tax=Dallia pectoralis TaxID=75939 RepID=A0ACC2G001_DALPE|nr:hypothetical protein DPEC_G00223210 [Dallia pectoralis]
MGSGQEESLCQPGPSITLIKMTSICPVHHTAARTPFPPRGSREIQGDSGLSAPRPSGEKPGCSSQRSFLLLTPAWILTVGVLLEHVARPSISFYALLPFSSLYTLALSLLLELPWQMEHEGGAGGPREQEQVGVK